MRGALFVVSAFIFAIALNGAPQRSQERPSIAYGTANVSLGMTVEQVEQSLQGGSRYMKTIPGYKDSTLVYVNGQSNPTSEGQIIFSNGRVTYADYKMPDVSNADELAQEIAGAVDEMETKTCIISNYTAHGTGGGFSQSTFECGARRFLVMTTQTLGNNTKSIHVSLEIGHAGAAPSK